MLPNAPRREPYRVAFPRASSPLQPRRHSEPELVYSTARPVIGFDLGLSRRLADLEDRARAEPKHQLVRVQGTIVLSRCELAPNVRAEMEAIVAPTEILFVTWRERLNKVDVNLKRGAGGILRVEMAQGSPTGIPLIRNRVEFRIQRKDAKTVIEPATEEMVGNTMVWHLPGNAAVPKGEALCVEVVSNGQILAQIDVEDQDPEEKEKGKEKEKEIVVEIVEKAEPEIIRLRRQSKTLGRRRLEVFKGRRHSQQLQHVAVTKG